MVNLKSITLPLTLTVNDPNTNSKAEIVRVDTNKKATLNYMALRNSLKYKGTDSVKERKSAIVQKLPMRKLEFLY